jgi:putative membrane protein
MTHAVRGSHLALAAVLAAALSGLPLFAQAQNAASGPGSQSSAAANPASAANPNQRAVTLMNTINEDEIDAAKLMESKAQSAKVRNFAKLLRNDHKGAEGKLRSIAASDRLTLSTDHAMQRRARAMDAKLRHMSAYKADTAFVQSEAREHAHAIRVMRSLEAKVNNPRLRKYITDHYIPMLEKHERHARTVLAEMGGPAAGEPASKAQPPHQVLNEPRYEHRPYDLAAMAWQNGGQNAGQTSGQSGTQNNAAQQHQGKPATPPPANAQPAPGQKPATGQPPAAAATPSRKAGMPATGSPLGLLVLAGAGLTGLGLGAKRWRRSKA